MLGAYDVAVDANDSTARLGFVINACQQVEKRRLAAPGTVRAAKRAPRARSGTTCPRAPSESSRPAPGRSAPDLHGDVSVRTHTRISGRQARTRFSRGFRTACSIRSITVRKVSFHEKTCVIENRPNQ